VRGGGHVPAGRRGRGRRLRPLGLDRQLVVRRPVRHA
jgi:hypothetical protein